jgi:hypothetical protein
MRGSRRWPSITSEYALAGQTEEERVSRPQMRQRALDARLTGQPALSSVMYGS